MATTIAPFHAARLWVERCQVELPFYPVDTTSHESLMESVETIQKSSHTPDEIKGMLAVVKAKAAEMFSEEELTQIFQDTAESDGAPFTIVVGSENWPLILEALDQLTASIPEPAESVEDKTPELETKIAELEGQVAEKDTKIEELTAKVREFTQGDYDPEGLRAKVSELESRLASLAQESSAKDETIDTLRSQLAEFAALKHDSLVKEAARLAGELKRAIAKDKGFEELCDALATRTDESLSDMIEDMKLELSSSETEEAAPEASSEVTEGVAPVQDPTIPVAPVEQLEQSGTKSKPTVEELAEQLHSTITEEPDGIYKLVFDETEYEEIFGETSTSEE